MELKMFLLWSIVVGVMAMITPTQGIPIEVVYTGDGCDCPKNLKYLVNLPPRTYEYKNSEYNYQLDVPAQAKAKVIYSFDFTVQEPRKPPPTEHCDLYAKIDRMTAPKKDCYATDPKSYKTCACHRCKATRNDDNRYVSSENRAIRSKEKFQHPNSISKNMPTTSKFLAIFLQPLEQPETFATKSRSKRDISRIFLRGRKNNNVKRQDRLIKQYNKRLQSRTMRPQQVSKETPPPPPRRRPFDNLKNLLVPPGFRNKRDIKGEYDIIEKEREQLDLTLPEITQFMPETLDPSFKRGQCQLCELQETQEQSPTPDVDVDTTTTTNDNTKETLENIDSDENDTNRESENDISSTLAKRNVAHYGCGLSSNSYNLQLANPIPTPGYSFHSNPIYDALPRPFAIADQTYGKDPVPQQYVGAPYNSHLVPTTVNSSPMVGAASYNPHGKQVSNAQLDRIIADIINRHQDFTEASTHRDGARVDSTEEQKYQTKSLLTNLWDGHLQKWLAEEPVDNSYSYASNYRAATPGPKIAPQSY